MDDFHCRSHCAVLRRCVVLRYLRYYDVRDCTCRHGLLVKTRRSGLWSPCAKFSTTSATLPTVAKSLVSAAVNTSSVINDVVSQLVCRAQSSTKKILSELISLSLQVILPTRHRTAKVVNDVGNGIGNRTIVKDFGQTVSLKTFCGRKKAGYRS